MALNIPARFFGLVTKHACDRLTDGETDRENYDSQDRVSHSSRGKNVALKVKTSVLKRYLAGRAKMAYIHLQYFANTQRSTFSVNSILQLFS